MVVRYINHSLGLAHSSQGLYLLPSPDGTMLFGLSGTSINSLGLAHRGQAGSQLLPAGFVPGISFPTHHPYVVLSGA